MINPVRDKSTKPSWHPKEFRSPTFHGGSWSAKPKACTVYGRNIYGSSGINNFGFRIVRSQ